MIFEIIARGVEAMPQMIPHDWNECTVVTLEEETFTVTFKEGKVSLAKGDKVDADSIVKLTSKKLRDAIDGSYDFMRLWMELAEPSNKSTVQKGSGTKLITFLELLSRTYKSDGEFKRMVDECKAHLTSK